jgi:hypothetical protein
VDCFAVTASNRACCICAIFSSDWQHD